MDSESLLVGDKELGQSLAENNQTKIINSESEINSVDVELDDNDQVEEENEEDVENKSTEEGGGKVVRLARLPISRIKGIMKFDDELNAASQEAVFLITKATELFILELSKEMYQFTLANKKKTVQKKDVENAMWSQDHFIFLDGCLNV